MAKSAVRNLNGYEIGGRALHVEVASDGSGGPPPPPAGPEGPPMLPPPTRWGPGGPLTGPPPLMGPPMPGPPMPGPPMPGPPPPPSAGPLGGRPMPVDPSQDAVLKTISSLTAQQLYDVVAALKVTPALSPLALRPCLRMRS